MKRLLLAAVGLAGSLFAVPTLAASAAPTPDPGVMVAASGSPPRVVLATTPVKAQTPTLPRYRVVAGDSLWSIGIRYHRGWPALAAYNRIPDANLIMVGQVLTIPPATYTPPTPVTVSAPAPVQHTYVAPQRSYVAPQPSYSGGGVWGCIAQHESGGNPATNTGNGYYGMYQDTIGSWQAAGGPPGLPSDYSAAVQTQVNQRIQAQQGWGAWPTTSRMCGA